MSDVDLAEELQGLEHGLDLFLLQKRPELCAASEGLRSSLRLRRGAASWPGSFSPLVSLYPMLQAEPFFDRLGIAARQACLPHLLLLVHSFVEDRILDRQRPSSRAELVFSKQLFCDAQSLLRVLAGDAPWIQTCIDQANEEYCRGELFSFPLGGSAERWPSVRRAVAGRAKLAGVAYQCLLRLAGASAAQLAMADAAFDALVVGLQWEDDLVDWTDDVATQSDNLLLWHLERSRGERLTSLEEIARAFKSGGVTRHALAAAKEEWRAAAELQREIGAPFLASLIDERIGRLEAFGERALECI